MEAIVISKAAFDTAFELFLSKVKEKTGSEEGNLSGNQFRRVNYYAYEFKDSLEKS